MGSRAKIKRLIIIAAVFVSIIAEFVIAINWSGDSLELMFVLICISSLLAYAIGDLYG